jgi:hypothetical protein
MDHTDPIKNMVEEKEKAYAAQQQVGAVGFNNQINQIGKPLTRLQQLQSEQTSLIKRLNQVSLMIEFLKDREYLQEALYEFDKLDSRGW